MLVIDGFRLLRLEGEDQQRHVVHHLGHDQFDVAQIQHLALGRVTVLSNVGMRSFQHGDDGLGAPLAQNVGAPFDNGLHDFGDQKFTAFFEERVEFKRRIDGANFGDRLAVLRLFDNWAKHVADAVGKEARRVDDGIIALLVPAAYRKHACTFNCKISKYRQTLDDGIGVFEGSPGFLPLGVFVHHDRCAGAAFELATNYLTLAYFGFSEMG
jgi:hypothetical protein